MPKLRQIIPILNTTIKAGGFTAKRFQKGSFDGIAELIKRGEGEEEQKFPVLVANDGICTDVGINDTKPFQVYHRILSLNGTDPEDGNNFGDQLTVAEEASMRLVVIGDRNRLELAPEDIMAGINLWLPRDLASSVAKSLDLESVQIIPGAINLNMQEVFEEEYPGTAFNLPPNSIMAYMDYQIISEYNKNCFSICP